MNLCSNLFRTNNKFKIQLKTNTQEETNNRYNNLSQLFTIDNQREINVNNQKNSSYFNSPIKKNDIKSFFKNKINDNTIRTELSQGFINQDPQEEINQLSNQSNESYQELNHIESDELTQSIQEQISQSPNRLLVDNTTIIKELFRNANPDILEKLTNLINNKNLDLNNPNHVGEIKREFKYILSCVLNLRKDNINKKKIINIIQKINTAINNNILYNNNNQKKLDLSALKNFANFIIKNPGLSSDNINTDTVTTNIDTTIEDLIEHCIVALICINLAVAKEEENHQLEKNIRNTILILSFIVFAVSILLLSISANIYITFILFIICLISGMFFYDSILQT